jgi:hypothetical protein
MLRDCGRAYDQRVAAVLAKHKATFAQMRKMEARGEYDRVPVLFRSSGLLDELVAAIAAAGQVSSVVIRVGVDAIREVMADDDGSEA